MYDLLVIPGGAKGAETISKHPSVQEVVRRYVERNKLVGMICAGASIANIYLFFLIESLPFDIEIQAVWRRKRQNW
jgi:hypothetical protein